VIDVDFNEPVFLFSNVGIVPGTIQAVSFQVLWFRSVKVARQSLAKGIRQDMLR
jgi:hypothetical protein